MAPVQGGCCRWGGGGGDRGDIVLEDIDGGILT